MMIDEFINDDEITNQIQAALKCIDKYSVEIDGVFDSAYAMAMSKFTNVSRDVDSIVITFANSDERDMCDSFFTTYIVDRLIELLQLDNNLIDLVYKIYRTDSYANIVRKR